MKDIKKYEKGDRRELIKISYSAGLIKSGDIKTFINGIQDDTTWFYENKTNQWILFEFKDQICIDGFKWYQNSGNYSQGTWSIIGSKDNINFTLLAENLNLGKEAISIFDFKNNNNFKYYKLLQTNGVTTNGPYIREVEFKIKDIDYKYLIEKDNKIYSANLNTFDFKNNCFKEVEKDFDKYGFNTLEDLITDKNFFTKNLLNNHSNIADCIYPLNQNIETISFNVNNLKKYENGNRQNFIKVSGTDKLPIYNTNSYPNLVNGKKEQDFYFNNAIDIFDQYIQFDLKDPLCIKEFYWYQNSNITHGKWVFQGSNDGIKFDNITEFTLGENEKVELNNNKYYNIYRLQGVEGFTSSSPWLYGIDFKVEIPLFKCLLKIDNDFLTIKDNKLIDLKKNEITKENYDRAFDITTYDKNLLDFSKEITLYVNSNSNIPQFDALFKIDKTINPKNYFNKFCMLKESTVDSIDNNILVDGQKENNQLIVDAKDVSISIAETIKKFNISKELSKEGQINFIFSTDKGNTWMTSEDGKIFKNINVTIPLKDYDTLKDYELTDWNNAIKTILREGIEIELFNHINFNSLKADYLRFAYVISKPKLDSEAKINKLDWVYDSNGEMQLMKDNEIDIKVYNDFIAITPHIETSKMKINIATHLSNIKEDTPEHSEGSCDIDLNSLPQF